MLKQITVNTLKRTDFLNITQEVQKAARLVGLKDGLCTVYVQHTTAGIIINENADPAVRADMEAFFEKLVPWGGNWQHLEGNAAAHIKAVLCGNSQNIPVVDGKLQLGTWQGIYLAEFDGPRTRKILLAFT
ncbi:MAG TPA: YjbQ family protein [Methanosarcina sp.]|nr:YjbQ family protein [Methanosarcina sp.]